MNIAVCEDEPISAEAMLDAIRVWAQARGHDGIRPQLYLSAEDLLGDWERGRAFDALFLDIEFAHMSGFELAQRIRRADAHVPIIFVTNSSRYLAKGYEVSAYRYLRKPVRQDEISACLDHCLQYTSTLLHDGFTIACKGLTVRLPYRDVLFIESGIHAVAIRTCAGQTYKVPLQESFAQYAQRFPQAYFLRCHRGYIVNLAHVRQYTRKVVTLDAGLDVPIGRSFADEALTRLHQYFYREAHV
ncbi:MAG: LytR/AlgR family response regulator transcription factor [Candidatus Spyradocola sp.]